MDAQLKQYLIDLANKYETKEFIKSDPIYFPRKVKEMGGSKQDIEISAFISAWLAYGSRKCFMDKIELLHKFMNWKPYKFIKSGLYRLCEKDNSTLYRFYKWNDFYSLCEALYGIYNEFFTLEDLLGYHELGSLKSLQYEFGYMEGIKGIPSDESNSSCKKLNMFLRWMIRKDSPVDLGTWSAFKPSSLIMPLDTHVIQESLKLGLINSKYATIKTAIELTKVAKEVFPDDPCRLDFALYGLGISKK